MTEKTHASLAIPARETEGGHALPPRNREWKRAKIAIWIVLALLAVGALRTVIANVLQSRSVAETTKQNATQYVNVVSPTQTEGGGNTLLPGTLRGFVESPIYARSTGYLLHWYADIGTRVKQGQLLADLDTPEIDQELAQALAQRAQTSSSLGLAKSSMERWQQLRQRDAVSQQELDERTSTYSQDLANLAAADANVKRLQQLESFKRIVAPFAGVVTQRNVDVGDLIDAGSGTSRALFALAQSDPLRVYVQLPQAYAQNVSVGQKVVVTQAELPGQQFHGTITHISGAIDVPTRSLQVEVTLPNPDDKLRPGAYVQVAVPAAAHAQLMVPGNALLFRAEGPRVAVVDANGTVALHKVVIAQDLGQSLEIESGIEANDKVIINPSDSIADGDHVLITQPKKNGKGAS
ncbi:MULTISPECIES: efflux RND transporter periplasmic adaptor subunit [Paraburkholderia]|uniref:RND family efflux transporter, MFP subunit n=1 Tax=Paraburkholderia aspalathi TaxID=1324617 RepID=A0A1I6Z5W5_9BURK|nr:MULTISPECIES: efflux RND transporter periplasmic adaptor subunit [Paraburkholderia]MCP2090689.1 RND family efflux transporter MFP subunit [Paraburkholderia sediminicola]MCX4142830.1 efflux RND transporter periplasmic adaptor subunit [Paraburkholderia aspalathi]MDN7175505.1 efflux RND transporter periplasmic adaptor subunit [Paraburkholderia sp. SEWSISQ10-3 4]MDQ6505146.1 efflux RND transporter periplasmic adaptor subunit [Paraburkholderia aspalathi]CAE6810371.1 Multidrug resistance protein 